MGRSRPPLQLLPDDGFEVREVALLAREIEEGEPEVDRPEPAPGGVWHVPCLHHLPRHHQITSIRWIDWCITQRKAGVSPNANPRLVYHQTQTQRKVFRKDLYRE